MRLMVAEMKASTLSYEGSGGYVPLSFASVEEGLAAIDRGGPENLTSWPGAGWMRATSPSGAARSRISR